MAAMKPRTGDGPMEVVKEAGQVHLFQRTANWGLPKEDDPFTEEQLEHFRQNPEIALEIRQTIFDDPA